MTLSPKKYTSNFTSSTVNRGVEAKEIEIADIRLDINDTCDSQSGAEASSTRVRAAPAAATPATPQQDTSSSYMQVVVHKHRRGGARAARASSPLRELAPGGGGAGCAGGGGGGAGDAGASAELSQLPAAPCNSIVKEDVIRGRNEMPQWKKCDGFTDEVFPSDDEPECVEVYYFEHGDGASLAVAGAGGARRGRTAAERAWRRAGRPARALLRELLAAPRLLALLPISLSLHLFRCALTVVRSAGSGAVQTAADYALKPALALAFNALVAPPLVCAGNTLRAARAALRPLWGALGDALEPAARLLAAARLVSVHLHAAPCRCRCSCADHV